MDRRLKKIILFLSLTLIFSMISCSDLTFNPEGDNYVNVPPPILNTDNIVINIDNIQNNDTTLITGYVGFKYSLNIDNKPVKRIILYIDSTLIGDSYSGQTYLDSREFPDGSHKLTMVITTGSGTGSLRDKLGYEGFTITKTFPVYIENSPSPPLNIISAEPDLGKLKLIWEKCKMRSFKYYLLIKENLNAKGDTITDVNQNYFYIDNFVGGTESFHINVTTAAGSTGGNVFDKTDSIPQISRITLLNNYSVKIEWDSCRYYSNVGSFSIQRYFNNAQNSTGKIAEIANGSDRSYIDGPLPFGAETEYSIVTHPVQEHFDVVSRRKACYIGTKWNYSSNIIYLPSTNSLYGFNNNLITRIDKNNLTELAVSDQSVGTYDIAADGSTGYASNPAAGNISEFWEIDPISMQKGKSYYTENFIGYKSVPLNIFYLKPDKVIYQGYTEKWTNNFYSDKMVLLNLSTGDTATLGSSGIEFPFLIQHSDNGKYIAVYKGSNFNIYNVSNNKFHLNYSTSSSLDGISSNTSCFFPASDNFITTENKTIRIRNCSNGTVNKEFTVKDQLTEPVIDPATGYLGSMVSNRNLYRIYDLQTGEVKNEIPVLGYSFKLQNSILFTDGYYLKIEY